jgi:hypothetical protein
MPSWSTRWSFFLVFGFALYVIARGDGPSWKQVFTQSMGSSTGASGAATQQTSSTVNPATNSSLAASGNQLAQSLTGTTSTNGISVSDLGTIAAFAGFV